MKQKHKHWNFYYIKNRIKVYLYENFWGIKPWLTIDAVKFLEKYLNENSIGFEWGSGRSTIWFAKNTKFLISVENNINWYNKVKVMIENRNLKNVRYLYFDEDENKNSPKFVDPKISNYVEAINKFKEEMFDYILVDGIFREYCALNAIPKLKKGGILIIDNINWFLPSSTKTFGSIKENEKPASKNWGKFRDITKKWKILWTTNGISDTGIFIKPV